MLLSPAMAPDLPAQRKQFFKVLELENGRDQVVKVAGVIATRGALSAETVIETSSGCFLESSYTDDSPSSATKKASTSAGDGQRLGLYPSAEARNTSIVIFRSNHEKYSDSEGTGEHGWWVKAGSLDFKMLVAGHQKCPIW